MMVFGLFGSRKPAPETVPARREQLRTPSPSESASASVATGPPQSPELMQRISPHKYTRSLSPALPPPSEPNLTPMNTDDVDVFASDLLALLKKIPPKTLHSFVVAHIPHARPHEIRALTTFLATLAPPPTLHCVRCHQGFVEVENDDRACKVPHDDDSAEVEHVGAAKGGIATYETIWGCCAKTVDGDGDQGPPDGWCYEGQHTTDMKRARFRADSTPQNDKLISCERMRCFRAKHTGERKRSERKRQRKSLKEDSNDEEEEEKEEEEQVEASEDEVERKQKIGVKRRKGKQPAKVQQEKDNDMMEVVEDSEGENTAAAKSNSSSKGKGKIDSMKRRSPKPVKPVPKSKPKPRYKPNTALAPDVHGTSDAGMPSPVSALIGQGPGQSPKPGPKPNQSLAPKQKQKSKKRKSGVVSDGGKYVPDSEVGESDDWPDDDKKPNKKRKAT